MEEGDTTYVVIFCSYELGLEQVHTAVVGKEAYYSVNKGDIVEFNVEAGKK
jgi:hypothetical protein